MNRNMNLTDITQHQGDMRSYFNVLLEGIVEEAWKASRHLDMPSLVIGRGETIEKANGRSTIRLFGLSVQFRWQCDILESPNLV